MKTRREILLTVAVVIPLSGCGGSGLADIRLWIDIETEEEVTVYVVQAATDREVLSEVINTPTDDTVYYRNPITDSGEHTVSISISDGRSTSYSWDVPEAEPNTDAYGLGILIDSEEIEFQELVH